MAAAGLQDIEGNLAHGPVGGAQEVISMDDDVESSGYQLLIGDGVVGSRHAHQGWASPQPLAEGAVGFGEGEHFGGVPVIRVNHDPVGPGADIDGACCEPNTPGPCKS